jgi:hypothetical protein
MWVNFGSVELDHVLGARQSGLRDAGLPSEKAARARQAGAWRTLLGWAARPFVHVRPAAARLGTRAQVQQAGTSV